ncbi:hypothetical protein COMA2_40236 [Candidatus Nitrospira nitrificans]|uniref:Uncharacterized protein n=1 Tax=Candidatus Nitrospira nitrificans TaxID=1742973 RepID=A0A0S4LNU2_9BACT|nr:hypothetical protein COMA2_40236 [Candidatus Nitrospira nitrificans]
MPEDLGAWYKYRLNKTLKAADNIVAV